MKTSFLYIRFLFLISVFFTFTQMLAQGMEKFNKYALIYSIDNFNIGDSIDFNLLPYELKIHYYNQSIGSNIRKCKKKIVRGITQEIDTANEKRLIMIVTTKAKKGYLQINKGLSEYIQDKRLNSEKVKIIYFLNNDLVASKEEVLKLIKLKKKWIKKVDYINDCNRIKINISTQ